MYTANKLSDDAFVDSLLASNSPATAYRQKKSCWSVRTQDTNLLLTTASIIMDIVEVGAILALVACKRRQHKHQFWVHTIYSARLSVWKFHIDFQRYRNYPNKFFAYYRTSVSSFDEVLTLVYTLNFPSGHQLVKKCARGRTACRYLEVWNFCKTYPVQLVEDRSPVLKMVFCGFQFSPPGKCWDGSFFNRPWPIFFPIPIPSTLSGSSCIGQV
jgi:hypothetical protein